MEGQETIAVATNLIDILISTTTGSNFQMKVDSELTVDGLKKILSKKLKVIKERISLLLKQYPER